MPLRSYFLDSRSRTFLQSHHQIQKPELNGPRFGQSHVTLACWVKGLGYFFFFAAAFFLAGAFFAFLTAIVFHLLSVQTCVNRRERRENHTSLNADRGTRNDKPPSALWHALHRLLVVCHVIYMTCIHRFVNSSHENCEKKFEDKKLHFIAHSTQDAAPANSKPLTQLQAHLSTAAQPPAHHAQHALPRQQRQRHHQHQRVAQKDHHRTKKITLRRDV